MHKFIFYITVKVNAYKVEAHAQSFTCKQSTIKQKSKLI